MDKNKLDVTQVFTTFQTFGGDVERTAVALNMDPAAVVELAQSENWGGKIAEWNKLREGQAGDVQQQINRAVNYVQAARLRNIVDKIVTHLGKLDSAELVDLMSTKRHDKEGNLTGVTISTRAITDLVKAAESAQLMTQRALGDTAQERDGENKGKPGSSIALMVQEAMSAAERSGLSSMELVRAELRLPAPKV